VHGARAPSVRDLERFVSGRNVPELLIANSHAELGRRAADVVIALLKKNPCASIALPTGETPKGLYSLLVSAYRKKEVDFSRATFFALDEYVGLLPGDRNSFSFFLKKHLLDEIDVEKRNVHLLDGSAKDLRKEVALHEQEIARFGLDLCILGIGRNGHIAFNEPGSSEYSITRVVRLSDQTRKVNGASFLSGFAPARALTVGVGTILHESKHVLLLASGNSKHLAVRALFEGKDPAKWPASYLRRHKNFTLLVDSQAYRGDS